MASTKRPNGYWTYERCYNEALKYDTKMAFRKGCLAAYDKAMRNNWLKDYTWFVSGRRARKWDYDACYKIALECRTIKEFRNKGKFAYCAALKNGWLKDYTWFVSGIKPRKFDYNTCYEIAITCKSKADFNRKSSGAYNAARRYGWIDEYVWFRRHPHLESDYVIYVYEDRINKVCYVGLTYRLKQRHSGHKQNGDPVKKYFNVVPDPKILMEELSQIDAQYYEDWYRRKYEEEGWRTLNRAKTGEGSSSLGGANLKWTRETCYKEALKYKTRREFQIKNGAAYKKALEEGWLDDYTWFLSEHEARSIAYRKWTYEKCLAERMKYNSKMEFRIGNYAAYQAAYKYGWLDEFFPKAA